MTDVMHALKNHCLRNKGTSTLLSIFAITAIFLSSCTTTHRIYERATEPGAPGFTDRQLATDRYLVTFYGDTDTSLVDVQDFALLRSAELTLAAQFDFFKVVEKNTLRLGEPVASGDADSIVRSPGTPQTSCSLLECTAYRDPGPVVRPVQLPVTETSYSTSLEIVLLSAVDGTEADDVYSAQEVIDSVLD